MKKLLILLLFPLMMLAQDSTLIGDVDCSGEVNSQDASLILQFVTNVIDELPCEANMTGLTPEQLQEIINLMSEQLNVNYTGGGDRSNYPSMISSISSQSMNFGSALIFCNELEEDGFSDWFLPTIEQLIYSVGGGCEIPDQRTDNVLWSSTPLFNSYYSTEYVYMIGENQDALIQSDKGNGLNRCRCVRFGEGETSEGSTGSSNSSTDLSSEQTITMIGPMYTDADYPDFQDWQDYYYDNGSNYMDYFSAIKFCSELEYNGYNDWRLPSINQIQNYVSNNNDIFSIPGFDDIGIVGSEYVFWTIKSFESSYNDKIYAIRISNSSNIDIPNRLMGFELREPITNFVGCFCVR